MKVFQPCTTDVTLNGLRIARNAMRERLSQENDAVVHRWLCHPHEACADGCAVAAIPERLALYESPIETG